MTDLARLDGAQISAAFRDGSLSPVELVRDTLARMEPANAAINAFTHLDGEEAVAAARLSEERHRKGVPLSPIDGLTVTVKDNVVWKGRRVRRGSRSSSEAPAGENAPAVDRLIEAGAIPVAKTTLPEFGWKGLGDSPLTGLTRNPWDTRMTTGGSSAGAAAAAALNLGILHIGTDGAGSIRIPGAFCGVFGIKPTFGRVPAYPPSPFAIVSHVGPLTRRVADGIAMLAAMARPDPRDLTAMVDPALHLPAADEPSLRGLRVAWSPRLGYVRKLDPEIERLSEAAARAFAELGAEVEEADPPISDPVATLSTLWNVGAHAILRDIPAERHAEMDPGLVALGRRGETIPGADFVAAANARGALSLALARFHERYDLLLTPTLAVPAFEAGHNTPPDGSYGSDWLAWTPYSYPFNLTLQPAATVPCGLTDSGLPAGLQIVAARGRDDLVLRAALAFEAARPWEMIDAPRIRH